MADGEYGNDPVMKTAESRESGGSIFDDLRWLRHAHAGSGAGTGSAGPTAHDTVFLVDSSGRVVGTAHHNPETGVLETDTRETMTVYRTSHPDIVPFVPATVPADLPIPQQAEAPKHHPEPVAQPQESGEETPTTDVVDPSVFLFRATGENWQETGCVRAVVFHHGGSAFAPPTEIVVGVNIGVPRRLRDGTPVTWQEAQIDSGVAAQGAADKIKALLNTHAIVPSQVQPLFAGYMGGALMAHGIGYRLNQCWPG
ncbi:hypothetical protein [Micromonospora foliorum]|uniref:hypothetical protein n=1 Tax=Micromonospora foliorum TaxID=2911210 RepID=UPI001EE8A69D|nr:hypothetical protein [Micromonospora foliorum]MCG5435369.1 hypothetical protein [Micromonospora foliorum]